MTIREVIVAEVERVAQEQNKALAALSDESTLLETGLDSLCFAVIVARLENQLGLDPFSDTEASVFPVTFGDLIRMYENSAKSDRTRASSVPYA